MRVLVGGVTLVASIALAGAIARGQDTSVGTDQAGPPETLEEAQATFDPENDPTILVDPSPDGGFEATYIEPVIPEGSIPDSVQTGEEFSAFGEQYYEDAGIATPAEQRGFAQEQAAEDAGD